ncbi:MAG: hypothetical protein K6A69_04565 [Lachnospiraceae bacterium]|nr:hypothetical protein [Lachnospiraceae bacterium]
MSEYDEKLELYKKLEELVANRLSTAIMEGYISVMQISHRLKERSSVEEKNRRKANKYLSITDMTDIVGIRVICYFSDQVDETAKIVEKLFDIDWENSIDKRAALAPTTFGYLSLHYTCRLKSDGTYDPELCELPFEIQIRSVLQHTWAEIEHDLGYKSEFGVPYHIRREFSRIAGVLEVADELFLNIRKGVTDYVEDVRNRIRNDEADDLLLDVNTINEFTRNSAVWQDLMDKVVGLSGGERIDVSSETFLPQLKHLGMNNLGDLKTTVINHRDHVLSLVKESLAYFEMDELSSNMILYYLCQACLIWGDYTDKQIEEFFAVSEKDKNKIKRQVERVKSKRAKI